MNAPASAQTGPNVGPSLSSTTTVPAQATVSENAFLTEEAPPEYTQLPNTRTGEATVEYGPLRPFQQAPAPLRPHPATGYHPQPQQPHYPQQPPQQPHHGGWSGGYPGAVSRQHAAAGWPPQQQQQQQPGWHPPPRHPSTTNDLGRRPSLYAVFRDGVPASRPSQLQHRQESTASASAAAVPPSNPASHPAPPVQNQSKNAATSPTSSTLDDARPTTSPVPGHPFLRNASILVYPASFECHKCQNTGYKNGDPQHPCRGCWDKYAKPFTGALSYAPFGDAAAASHSGINLQRPLPRLPAPATPATSSAPSTVYGQLPGGYAPPQPHRQVSRMNTTMGPGPTVVRPGDPRIGGRLCYRCHGEGMISLFIFDSTQCPACNGMGRILN